MIGSIRPRRTKWVVPILLGLCASVRGDIITVPGDYSTIQAGINGAQDGDEVVVSPGTYLENIDFVGRDITVRGTDPLDPRVVDATTIDGLFIGRCVLMDRGTLSGFTIQHGTAWNGGGVFLQHLGPDAEISHNVIMDCTAQYGGGIRAGGGSTGAVRIVRDNVVQNNEAWAGAGIAAGSVLVENNLICFNETDFFKYAHGGGISVGTSAVVRGNVIVGNVSWDLGGGVNALGYSTIEDNLIADNFSLGSGGGVYIDIVSFDVVVRNNTITGNFVEGCFCASDWSGGGVKIAGVGTVIGNIIVGNEVSGFGGDGGGVAGLWTGTIIGNLIVGNVASGPGGGVSSTRSSLFGNTIAGNTTGKPEERGGGVALAAAVGGVVVQGNVIAYSSTGDGLYIYPESEPFVADYNCVFGNAGGDYGGAAQPGAHDINADPLFVQLPDPGPDGEWGTKDDDYGDLRLQPGSPCIDAADNSAVPADETDLDNDGDTNEPLPLDLDGNPRFIDDPLASDTGAGECPIVDMGAYEFQDGTTACCPADLDGDGVVGASDLAELLGSWGPCPDCPADLDGNDQVGPFDLALLLGAWGPCP